MSRTVLIEISTHPQGRACANSLHVSDLLESSGLKNVTCKKVSRLYRLEGNFEENEVKKIVEDLLNDPIAQSYAIDARPGDKSTLYIDVWLKPGVTDSVGESVLKAITDLKVSTVESASSGTRYELSSGSRKKPGGFESAVERFVAKEILNPLVQECKILKL